MCGQQFIRNHWMLQLQDTEKNSMTLWNYYCQNLLMLIKRYHTTCETQLTMCVTYSVASRIVDVNK